MLHIDLPTTEQFRALSRARADACVSIYLETTSLSQHTDAARIELGNLLKKASGSSGRPTSPGAGWPRWRGQSST